MAVALPLALHAKAATINDFVAFRVDRSYAACYRVLHEVCCRLPGFAPTSGASAPKTSMKTCP